jgi:hypothetical protein
VKNSPDHVVTFSRQSGYQQISHTGLDSDEGATTKLRAVFASLHR